MTQTNIGTWSPEQASAAITMTQAARTHVKKMIAKQGHGSALKFGVKKSGCSGYAYVVDIIDAPSANDHVFKVGDGIVVVVDDKSLPIVVGTEIDYIREGINFRFQFNNPRENASCGCGESFSVSEGED